MKLLLRFAGVGAVGVFAICDLCVPAGGAAVRSDAMAAVQAFNGQEMQLKTVTLHVDGMTCGGCAISARTVLRRLAGVETADVSYQKKLAVVTYNPGMVTPEQMIRALKDKLGYTAKQVEGKVT